jgi:hypothetical protein
MAVPKNLVYVFLFAIVLPFGAMIYVVYSEKDLSSFMVTGYLNERNEHVVVHPLFQHFKKLMASMDSYPDSLRATHQQKVLHGILDEFSARVGLGRMQLMACYHQVERHGIPE